LTLDDDQPAASAEAELPPYAGIRIGDVHMVTTLEQAASARDALLASDAIGFDTESKPTFTKGETSTGPHLIQFSTDDKAYLIQIGGSAPAHLLALLQAVLEQPAPLKIGFGLSDDVKRLHAKLAIRAAGVVDLSVALRTPGQRNDLGAKTAVAKFFGQKLQKSKKISTTNWALPRLNDKQILYAADDAQVALRVYRHWIAAGNKLPADQAGETAEAAARAGTGLVASSSRHRRRNFPSSILTTPAAAQSRSGTGLTRISMPTFSIVRLCAALALAGSACHRRPPPRPPCRTRWSSAWPPAPPATH
jgi:ribonuclease D